MIGLVLDIETTGWLNISPVTGTLPDANEILEVGYIRINMDTREILSCGELYFYKPYFCIESDAQQVHGITREFISQFEDEFQRNLVILNALIQRTCIIGKNSNKFDVPYIKEFLRKHSNGYLDITQQVALASIKQYGNGPVLFYDVFEFALDIQNIFAPTYRDLYYKKNGIELSGRKKGNLQEYIDVLGAGRVVDKIYSELPKKRETRAHGALYDAVMTYVVWAWCKQNQLY